MTLMRDNVREIISSPFVDSWVPQHQLGPDYIIPTDQNKTSDIDGCVTINHSISGPNTEPPMSVVTFLSKAAINYGDHVALVVKRGNDWTKWSYCDFFMDVGIVAKGLIKLGLQPRDGVGILGFNSPEWFMTHMGAIFAGGFATGIYTTNSPEACYQVLNDCSASTVVVENETQLRKILQIKNKLGNLKTIIQYTGQPSHPDVFSWDELMMIGKSVPDEVLTRRIKGLAVNQCCCLIYTSGTTGNAKGVMLHHDNLFFTMSYLARTFPLDCCKEIHVSYLPLSHVAALVADIYGSIAVGTSVYFATPDALKGKLVETLTVVQPTTMIGVPRVWEKIYEKVKDVKIEMTTGKKSVLSWAQNKALSHNMKKLDNPEMGKSIGYKLAEAIVLRKIKKLLGFSRNKCLITGGAPISKDVLKFFLSLDIPVYESYGLSETSGPHFVNSMKDSRLGSVGKAPVIQRTKIDHPDETGRGEILLKGRSIFMGYLHMDKETQEVIDDEGWFHTGDIGYLDKNQFLFVTGRIKELLITSGGENVAPVPIEDIVKELLPIVSNCMLIGDQKKFLSMLITIKTEVNLDTMLPTDDLSPAAILWCRKRGCYSEHLSDILNAGPDPILMQGIQEGINEYNDKFAISNAQRIQKWVILKKDFSLGGEELGPTMKLKRPVVLRNYASLINQIYSIAE